MLSELIVGAIQDKKGKKIVQLDLRNIEEASADYFVVCEANNPVQVRAIAENVIREVKEQTGEIAIGKEGTTVGEWVLVDFFNVVVHVFYEPIRQVYLLEDLWGDAKRKEYEDFE
ncbi:MAG: ribosome silencing factor [Saprospiraceae bacterium]|nr:ribosome silencing factor [Saprospiraceae bacterium]